MFSYISHPCIYPFQPSTITIRWGDQDSTEYTPWHIAAQPEYTKWCKPLVHVFFVFYSEIVIEHIISSSLLLHDKIPESSTYPRNISFEVCDIQVKNLSFFKNRFITPHYHHQYKTVCTWLLSSFRIPQHL